MVAEPCEPTRRANLASFSLFPQKNCHYLPIGERSRKWVRHGLLQIAILNIAILGLLVLLFGAMASVRPDDRLRCWEGGWISIFAHFGVDFWTPHDAFLENVRLCLSFDFIALAGIMFLVSTMVMKQGRKAGLQLGFLVALGTFPCLDLATLSPHQTAILAILVAVRQGLASFFAVTVRPNRRLASGGVIGICTVTAIWMFYGLEHGQPELVVYGLLTEIFVVNAIDFWSHNPKWTLGLNTMGVGLLAWAGVFPLYLLVSFLWPELRIESEFWNMPKLCVAIGMILVVLEEGVREAHTLTEEYRLLFEANPHPLWVFDKSTLRFLNVNRAALDLHGYTREEFLRLRLPDVLDPATVPQVEQEVECDEPVPNRASRHIRKDGTLLPMDITAYSIDFQGRPCRFILGIDVSEREALTQQLVHQAQHDLLTGLPNRLLFQEQLTAAMRLAVKEEEMVAVLCLDVIRLKSINDTYGLRIGDECVKQIAGILGQRARSTGHFVARTGGGEFAIALTGIKNAVAVEQAAKDIRQAFAQPLLIQGYKIQLSFSIGVAVCPDDGTDPAALWRHAESAQRRSRTQSGGEITWFSPELNRAAEEHLELEAYIRTQLDEGGFYLAYQPLYSFDGTVKGVEALLRLNHPRYGSVSPAKFIPIAEETGLIVRVGGWVLEEACRQLSRWRDAGHKLVPVAVNVSGMQLMHEDFAGQVVDALERFAIEPKWIHLEVTETAVMQNVVEVAERMAALSALGIEFSIDDFGTGHSSLGRLHQLPISILKIDKSFVDQLCLQNGTFSIVQAVTSMAHALGLQVVAEGVEKPAQLSCLHTLQCDLLQGFLLSQPIPPESVPALVTGLQPALWQVLDTTQATESDWVF